VGGVVFGVFKSVAIALFHFFLWAVFGGGKKMKVCYLGGLYLLKGGIFIYLFFSVAC
jgi:hypothetical protein